MADRKYRDPYQEYTDATDVGADKLLLSAEQQAGISQAKADWQKAFEAGDQAGMDAAHQRAESYRAQAGYSGGANGGAYNPFAGDDGRGVHTSGTHMTSPTWTPRYQQERDATLAQIQSRKPFSYDPEKDPTYLQYKAQYERGAAKAMEDTMGRVMARTGGMASSFAQTAGQQSYNATMAQLADKVPELRQLAYQMYMNEGDRLRADLQMYDSLDSSDASRWQAAVLNPFQVDRAYAKDVEDTLYSRGQDALNRQWQEKLFDTEREDVAYERQWNENERDYTRKRAETQDQEDKEKALAELLASGGNYSGYQGLYGMSPEDAAALGALWKEGYDYDKKGADLDLQGKALSNQLTQKQIANIGKSSGGGGNPSGENDPLSLIKNMSESEAKRTLLGLGLPQWQVTEYMDLWKDGGSPQNQYYSTVQKTAAGYKDIKEAKAYLERMVDGGYISPEEAAVIYQVELGGGTEAYESIPATYKELVAVIPKGITPFTSSEFGSRKRANSSAVAEYANYQDYLQKMYEKYKK